MYGVVIGGEYGTTYATFGTAEECFAFISRGGTRGLGKALVIRNPENDEYDSFGKRAPSRKVIYQHARAR